MAEQSDTVSITKFRIFRRTGGRPCDLMTYGDGTPVSATETAVPAPADERTLPLDHGHDLQVLFDMPGLSLVHAWFKSGYPLPRHTHNVDCLYYIVGGSLRMGEDELHAGDGFFVGADVPYTYTPGPEGLEILEFRPSNSFDIRVMGDPLKTREKSIATLLSRQGDWAKEQKPTSAA